MSHLRAYMWRLATLLVMASALRGAAGCELGAEAICGAKGPGVHCHPCSAVSYVVCESESAGKVAECPAGRTWDAFRAACVTGEDAGSPASGCVLGASVNVPADGARPDSSRRPPARRQSWSAWASAGLGSLVASVRGAAAGLAAGLLPAGRGRVLPGGAPSQQQQQPSLRTAMLVGRALLTPGQFAAMQEGLAQAADMQARALWLLEDADRVAAAANQERNTARALLLGSGASALSSRSAAAAAAAAAKEARRRMTSSDDAEAQAAGMQLAAQALLDASASEAAGVALALAAATGGGAAGRGLPRQPPGIGEEQRLGGGGLEGALLQRQEERAALLSRLDEVMAEEAAIRDELVLWAEGGVWGDVGYYEQEDEDEDEDDKNEDEWGLQLLDGRDSDNSVVAAAAAAASALESALADEFVDVFDAAAADEEGEEDAHGLEDLDTAATAGVPETADYYYDDEQEEAGYSAALLLGASLQDRLLQLVARAVAERQGQLRSGVGASDEEAAALLVGPMPLHMALRREDELLRLAATLEAFAAWGALSTDAEAVLLDGAHGGVAAVGLQLVGGLPAVVLPPALRELLPAPAAEELRRVVDQQAVSLFADLMALAEPGNYVEAYLDPLDDYEYTAPAAAAEAAAAAAAAASEAAARPEAGAGSQAAAAAAAVSGKQTKGRDGAFDDPQLLRDLDNALLEIELQQQEQQRQQQRQQQQQAAEVAEVAQRWQARSRKGMAGRASISVSR